MIIPIISYHNNCHFPKANRRWSHRGDLKINSFRSVCSAKYSFDTLYSRPHTPLFALDLSAAFELCSTFVFGVTFPPFFCPFEKFCDTATVFFRLNFFSFSAQLSNSDGLRIPEESPPDLNLENNAAAIQGLNIMHRSAMQTLHSRTIAKCPKKWFFSEAVLNG